jgi:IS30 family transposase
MQKTVCSLVATGVSLRQAAHFVNCDPKTIRREALRNDDFRRELERAKSEASMQPLATLRRAANSNWRAALCFMERLEPLRFDGHNAKIITQREANHFAIDLVESIQRAVSSPSERKDLFELLSAAMPAAMRRRWNGQARRRGMAEAMNAIDAKRKAAQERAGDMGIVQADPLPAAAPNEASANELTTNDDT